MAHPVRRLVLLGWAGADWRVLQPLLDAGQMPNLQSLIERGVFGNLLSLPPAVAASRWVSVACGCRADVHGVLGYCKPSRDGAAIELAGSTDLRAVPIWELLQQAGRRGCVVGWPMTHPATRFEAVVVSDAFADASGASFDDWPVMAGVVSRASMAAPLAEVRLHPSEVTADQILPFCPQAARIDQETDGRLPFLAATLARAASVHGAGTWLAERGDWDLLAIHFDLIERLSAAFMGYRAPRMPQVSETDFEIYRDVVDGGYQFMDLLLGRYLELVGAETHVMIVSAHGFNDGPLRRAPPPTGLGGPVATGYRPFGIMAVAGPGIRRDELLFGAGLLDIAPTALRLLDIPMAPQSEGKVLDAIFIEPQASAIRQAGHADGPWEPDAPAEDVDRVWADDKLRELVMLGYVEALPRDLEAAAERAEITWLDHLAQVKAARGQHEGALQILEKLFALDPDRWQTRLAIAQRYFAMGEIARCREVLDGLVASGLRGPFLDYLLGQLFLKEGNAEAAHMHLQRAEEGGMGGRMLLERIGRTHLQATDWDAAERSFRKALDLDPDFALGHRGLGIALAARRLHAEAVEHLLRSVVLVQAQPDTYVYLGRSLLALGRTTKATEAFRAALALQPGLAAAQEGLERARSAPLRQAFEEARAQPEAPGTVVPPR